LSTLQTLSKRQWAEILGSKSAYSEPISVRAHYVHVNDRRLVSLCWFSLST
jgi:hypothetical protein